MGRSPVTLERARAAKATAVRQFARMPDLNGIGLCRRGEGYAVKINFENEPTAEIPDTIGGVEIIVEVVGKIRKLREPPGRGKPPAFHVVPEDEGWAVRRAGTGRPSSIHGTQREAIEAARELARDALGAMVVHARDGSIRKRASYRKQG